MRNSKPILLVEDDSVDIMTVKRAIRDLEIPGELVPASDGEEALACLLYTSPSPRELSTSRMPSSA